MGRINGLGVYEPAAAKPLPILHKKKSPSSNTPALPSIHWSEVPAQPNSQPPQRPSFLKSISRPATSAAKKPMDSVPQQMHQSLKKMGVELIKDHATGQPKPKFSRPLLQAGTPSPSVATTPAPSVKAGSKTSQPTSMPTPNVTMVPYPGAITTGYAAMYALYAATDSKCASAPQYAYFNPLGTCIANGDGSALKYSADVSEPAHTMTQ